MSPYSQCKTFAGASGYKYLSLGLCGVINYLLQGSVESLQSCDEMMRKKQTPPFNSLERFNLFLYFEGTRTHIYYLCQSSLKQHGKNMHYEALLMAKAVPFLMEYISQEGQSLSFSVTGEQSGEGRDQAKVQFQSTLFQF